MYTVLTNARALALLIGMSGSRSVAAIGKSYSVAINKPNGKGGSWSFAVNPNRPSSHHVLAVTLGAPASRI
jgi:hypothetical protein